MDLVRLPIIQHQEPFQNVNRLQELVRFLQGNLRPPPGGLEWLSSRVFYLLWFQRKNLSHLDRLSSVNGNDKVIPEGNRAGFPQSRPGLGKSFSGLKKKLSLALGPRFLWRNRQCQVQLRVIRHAYVTTDQPFCIETNLRFPIPPYAVRNLKRNQKHDLTFISVVGQRGAP